MFERKIRGKVFFSLACFRLAKSGDKIHNLGDMGVWLKKDKLGIG